jgi:predicted enzyme related to lactoylglutathione lyase
LPFFSSAIFASSARRARRRLRARRSRCERSPGLGVSHADLRVDGIEAALHRVRELGGQVEEMDIEGDDEKIARFGRFKLCRDDQGSSFGLHQPPSG